jgi:hypothetical protein
VGLKERVTKNAVWDEGLVEVKDLLEVSPGVLELEGRK